jgi:hypothetical protein
MAISGTFTSMTISGTSTPKIPFPSRPNPHRFPARPSFSDTHTRRFPAPSIPYQFPSRPNLSDTRPRQFHVSHALVLLNCDCVGAGTIGLNQSPLRACTVTLNSWLRTVTTIDYVEFQQEQPRHEQINSYTHDHFHVEFQRARSQFPTRPRP